MDAVSAEKLAGLVDESMTMERARVQIRPFVEEIMAELGCSPVSLAGSSLRGYRAMREVCDPALESVVDHLVKGGFARALARNLAMAVMNDVIESWVAPKKPKRVLS